jgi:AraC-like DNA-binding protein
MFDFIFNAADALLLLNFIFACLLMGGAWYFRTLLVESRWFALVGLANVVCIFMVFSYFQESIYRTSQSVLDSPLMVTANIVHFLTPLTLMALFRRKLQSTSYFTWIEKSYLVLSIAIMAYFMYRYIFADFYMCPSMQYCLNNSPELGISSPRCSERTYCAVNGLFGLASVLKLIFVAILVSLWLKHKNAILSGHWLLPGVLLSYGVFWAWRSLSALLIVTGVIPVESTVGSLLFLQLCCAGLLFAWFIQLVSAKLLTEHGQKISAEQDLKYKFDKNIDILERYLEKHQPQFQKNLTLDRLAEQVGLPSRELSSVINQHFQTNYTDFLNSLRIEQAKILLNVQDEPLSVQVIFSQIGFNSKTAFNTAFKKQTGMTPTQFRNQPQ